MTLGLGGVCRLMCNLENWLVDNNLALDRGSLTVAFRCVECLEIKELVWVLVYRSGPTSMVLSWTLREVEAEKADALIGDTYS
jgi:hypothetical protein